MDKKVLFIFVLLSISSASSKDDDDYDFFSEILDYFGFGSSEESYENQNITSRCWSETFFFDEAYFSIKLSKYFQSSARTAQCQ